jgi:hypothetical protein
MWKIASLTGLAWLLRYTHNLFFDGLRDIHNPTLEMSIFNDGCFSLPYSSRWQFINLTREDCKLDSLLFVLFVVFLMIWCKKRLKST